MTEPNKNYFSKDEQNKIKILNPKFHVIPEKEKVMQEKDSHIKKQIIDGKTMYVYDWLKK